MIARRSGGIQAKGGHNRATRHDSAAIARVRVASGLNVAGPSMGLRAPRTAPRGRGRGPRRGTD